MSAMNGMAVSDSVRTFFVTGATDGIGRHTALKLASDGHRVLVHGKNPPKSEVVRNLLAEIRGRGAHSTSYLQANFLDLRDVSRLAEAVRNETEKLDVLVNNAAIFNPDEKASAQGYDATWAFNVLAPFKLTMLLLPVIAKGTHPRIITTSSIHQSPSLPSDVASIGLVAAEPEPFEAYSLSKLGDRLFTVGLADRLRASIDPRLSGIKCLSLDPDTTNTDMLDQQSFGFYGGRAKARDNTYTLAASNVDNLESGSFSFGGTGSADARKTDKVNFVWNLLEKQTGSVYSEENAGAGA